MIEREKYREVVELLDSFPAVAIIGPRQVGKTTLAHEIAETRPSVYLDLESERDRVKLSDPGYYLRQHSDKLIVLDEIHKVPEIFQEMRGVIDENRRKGRKAGQFLILGSAAIDLLRQSGESLAGRISYCEMFPLNIREVGRDRQEQLWWRGGYPDSFLAKNDRLSDVWRRDFIRTYLERDVPEFGPRISAERLRRFWTMLAHLHGGLLNSANLARSLEVDNKTITNYLDLLVDLLLVRRLQPWHANVKKRLVKSPKVYLRDSGILHTLLQIPDFEALLGNPKLGDSWEGFVVENIVSALPAAVQPYFYRTAAGAEIDLVLDFGQEIWAIEIKKTTAPKLSKGFHLACEDLQPARKYVVYGGDEAFGLTKDITAIPLAALMDEISDLQK
ncbi:MAG: ATP-binding protein [Marinosulfonomonas sp.]|nr:ATP-binding protein [Marinosulfonomonas sp.]